VIRVVGYLLTEALWSLVHRLLDKRVTWDHEDDDRTTQDAFAAFVAKSKHPPEGG